VRLKTSIKQAGSTCGDDSYCVQLYSRSAALVNEFCLDKRASNIADMAAAEELLRLAVAPCDFAATTVALISGEGTHDEVIWQFDPRQT